MPGVHAFCAACGAPLAASPDAPEAQGVCTNPECGRIAYRNAKPCAGALIEQGDAVLLVRRNIEPYYGLWDIPGGYLNEDEHPADGARREAREETGLAIELTRLLGIFLEHHGSGGGYCFNVYYRARPVGGRLAPADDAAEARWFPATALPAAGALAFPSHIPQVLAAWHASVAADPRPDPAADPTLTVHLPQRTE